VRRRRTWGLLAAGALALAGVAVLAIVLLTGGDEGGDDQRAAAPPAEPSIPIAGKLRAQVRSKGVDLATDMSAMTPAVRPGDSLVVAMNLVNQGSSTTGGGKPVTVRLPKTPPGVRLAAVNPALDDDAGTGDAGWRCQGDACSYMRVVGNNGQVAPAPIPSGAVMPITATLAVDQNQRAATPNPREGSETEVQLAVEADGDVKPANAQGTIKFRVADGTPSTPNLVAQTETPPVVSPGVKYSATYSVVNAGTRTAGGDGDGPDELDGGVVNLAGLLPPGVASDWEATGNGWSCRDGADPSTPVCTYEADTLEPGEITDDLKLTFTVREDLPQINPSLSPEERARRSRELANTPPGKGPEAMEANFGPDSPTARNWTLVTRGWYDADGGSQVMTASDDKSLGVAPPLGPDLRIDVNPTGTTQVSPGEGVRLPIRVTNLGAQTSSDTVVTIQVPDKFDAPKLAAGEEQWTCDTAARPVRCVLPADKPLAKNASSAFTLTFQVRDSVDPGNAPLAVAIVTEGAQDAMVGQDAPGGSQSSDAAGGGTTETVPYRVMPAPIGSLAPLLYLERSDGQTVQWVNGKAATLNPERPVAVGLSLQNSGRDLAPGRQAHLTIDLPLGVSVVSAKTLPDGEGDLSAPGAPPEQSWECAVEERQLGCTITSRKTIAPDQSLPRLVLGLVGEQADGERRGQAKIKAVMNNAELGDQTIRGEGSFGTEIPAKPKPDLFPNVTVAGNLRAGVQGRLQVTVLNQGDAPTEAPPAVDLPLAKGVEFVGGAGRGWTCTPNGPNDAPRCVSTGALEPGAMTPALLVDVRPTAQAAAQETDLKITAVGSGEGMKYNDEAEVPVTIGRQLQAEIGSPPTTVPEFQPEAKLDGKPIPPRVPLNGTATGSEAEPVSYRWRQLCTTAASVAADRELCGGKLAPKVTWLDLEEGQSEPTTQNAAFSPPRVQGVAGDGGQKLAFELEVSTPSGAVATARATTTVVTNDAPPSPEGREAWMRQNTEYTPQPPATGPVATPVPQNGAPQPTAEPDGTAARRLNQQVRSRSRRAGRDQGSRARRAAAGAQAPGLGPDPDEQPLHPRSDRARREQRPGGRAVGPGGRRDRQARPAHPARNGRPSAALLVAPDRGPPGATRSRGSHAPVPRAQETGTDPRARHGARRRRPRREPDADHRRHRRGRRGAGARTPSHGTPRPLPERGRRYGGARADTARAGREGDRHAAHQVHVAPARPGRHRARAARVAPEPDHPARDARPAHHAADRGGRAGQDRHRRPAVARDQGCGCGPRRAARRGRRGGEAPAGRPRTRQRRAQGAGRGACRARARDRLG
jgi:hypothetical protein